MSLSARMVFKCGDNFWQSPGTLNQRVWQRNIIILAGQIKLTKDYVYNCKKLNYHRTRLILKIL